MIRLATVIESFGADFLTQYRHKLKPEHTRALSAMKQCRTQASPKMQVQCTGCEHQRLVPHSCGHRHCPHCQHHESQQWLERQLQKRVPATYFLLTFTLPAEFRPLAFHHQKTVYDLLMRCSWETVRTFSQNDNWPNSEIILKRYFTNPSAAISACFKIARKVPSGMSPG